MVLKTTTNGDPLYWQKKLAEAKAEEKKRIDAANNAVAEQNAQNDYWKTLGIDPRYASTMAVSSDSTHYSNTPFIQKRTPSVLDTHPERGTPGWGRPAPVPRVPKPGLTLAQIRENSYRKMHGHSMAQGQSEADAQAQAQAQVDAMQRANLNAFHMNAIARQRNINMNNTGFWNNWLANTPGTQRMNSGEGQAWFNYRYGIGPGSYYANAKQRENANRYPGYSPDQAIAKAQYLQGYVPVSPYTAVMPRYVPANLGQTFGAGYGQARPA